MLWTPAEQQVLNWFTTYKTKSFITSSFCLFVVLVFGWFGLSLFGIFFFIGGVLGGLGFFWGVVSVDFIVFSSFLEGVGGRGFCFVSLFCKRFKNYHHFLQVQVKNNTNCCCCCCCCCSCVCACACVCVRTRVCMRACVCVRVITLLLVRFTSTVSVSSLLNLKKLKEHLFFNRTHVCIIR